MSELKPCPFCGGEAKLWEHACGEFNIYVEHREGCWFEEFGIGFDFEDSEKAEFVKAWNARACGYKQAAEYSNPLANVDAARDAQGMNNHKRLFGTPERAARTLETIVDSLFSSAWSDDNATLSDVMCALVGKCDECVAQGLPGRGVSTKCGEVDYDALLEWLRGDAE